MVRKASAWGILTVLLATLLGSLLIGLTASAPAQAQIGIPSIPGVPGVSDACSLLPSGAAEGVCDAVTDPTSIPGRVVDQVPGLPNPVEIAKDAAEKGFEALVRGATNFFAEAVISVLGRQIEFISSSTNAEVDAQWFLDIYRMLFTYGIGIALVLAIFRGLKGALKGNTYDIGAAVSTFLAYLYVAGIFPFVVGGVSYFFNGVLAPAWMESGGKNAEQTIQELSTALANVSSDVGPAPALGVVFGILLVGWVGSIIMAILFYIVTALTYVVVIACVITMSFWVGGGQMKAINRNMLLILSVLVTFKWAAAVIFVISINMISRGEDSVDAAILGMILLITMPVILLIGARIVTNTNFHIKVDHGLDMVRKYTPTRSS